MTPDELKQQRVFLENESGGRTGRTHAPCPGCGRTFKRGMSRPKDQVCSPCRRLLLEALAAREQAASCQDEQPYHCGMYGYYEGTYSLGSFEDGIRYRLEYAMRDLLLAVSRSAPAAFDYATQRAASLLPAKEPAYGRMQRTLRLVRPDLAERIEALDVVIREALIDASATGQEKGSNILLSLATGTLSIDAFNKATLKKDED